MKHENNEFPTERFWRVTGARRIVDHESFWDTEQEARTAALTLENSKVEPPEPDCDARSPFFHRIEELEYAITEAGIALRCEGNAPINNKAAIHILNSVMEGSGEMRATARNFDCCKKAGKA